MGFKRMVRWLILSVMPLLLFTGCGDLEPDMQDTRTVILNMDFHGKSSSRTSSSVSASELSQYNTHLILALPSREYLTSSYKNYYSSFAQELMNPQDKKVSLEIPLNTNLKIFAFLFKENYSMSQLISGTREVGYYGESQSFSIDTNTNSLSLGITLIGTSSGDTDTTAPAIEQVTAIASPTSDSTPNYTFSSDEAGTITYGGSCSSGITSATSGNNTITLVSLNDGTYSDCTITVTDSAGNASNTLTITPFTVVTTAPVVAEVTAVTTPTNDNTPNYTFSTNKAGTITYGGSCSSGITSATSGNNTITLVSLNDGTYSDCTITVTDSAGNASNTLTITPFTVDTTAPTSSSSSSSSGSGVFVAVGGSGNIVRSTDNGTTWDNVTRPTTNWIWRVIYENSKFLATSDSGNILSSSDNGTTWDNNSTRNTNGNLGITYGNNKFVSVGYNGNILSSSDNGTTWDNETSGITGELRDVTYGNNKFVAVGASGKILTSSDNGTSWDNRTSGISSSLYEVVFGNNIFVAAGSSGTIITSSDNGTTWDNRTSGTSSGFWGVGF